MSGNDLRSPTPGLFSISEHSATLHPPDEATPADATSSINESTDDDDRAPLVNPGLSSTKTPQPAPDSIDGYFTPLGHASPQIPRPSAPPRRQSLLPDRQTTLIQTLLHSEQADELGLSGSDHLLPINASMMTRKIWVKRPSASATLVTINEDDLVDDVRDMILRKYANSLGRQFDAPDITLRIVPREQRQERALAPDEPMGRTLDAYFPGGQTVDEALIIDIPLRRTPRASPRGGPPGAGQMASFYYDDLRPVDPGTDYFGPGAVAQLPVTLTAPSGGSGHSHSISILNTGQIPQIPSPGGTRSRPYRERDRPQLGRHNTASPTVLSIGGATITVAAGHGTQPAYFRAPRPRTHSSASTDHPPGVGITASPMPTPPGADGMPMSAMQRASTPPPRGASPRPNANPRSKKKKMMEPPSLPAGMLNGGVPPINVLIVEDNIINLKLLEAFVKRLKVRWQTAMNGREAVNKWRAGGFHLVLMDIQLPVMSGLDATREIRRLERINSIGVFSSGASNPPEEAATGEPAEEDRLVNKEMLKSPVIIVALTASSLQSDRHEALAAGCNDFLTKPVNFVWLERKVMEWGCMQALIDFDGWRKWKDFSQQDEDISASKKALAKAKTKKNRQSLSFTS
ncbi:response regulator receiver domain-containing protein [Phialemonium atrogriseum]|uniref:Response regulator receiver domain-containing protein n=1 Tax=Phialemonium atrogriseum TaxID=1093897 RepID=A0AAJ0C2G7_9PEZI|nr:response regulator receiver domain-containing protein [Phialemonium atrogriseum]KAK1768938.1 response regulator receiver domain-containing protein [Phialemonium atrogriseum]